MSFWRDIDSSRREYGVTFWATGCELRLGHRLYRARWAS